MRISRDPLGTVFLLPDCCPLFTVRHGDAFPRHSDTDPLTAARCNRWPWPVKGSPLISPE